MAIAENTPRAADKVEGIPPPASGEQHVDYIEGLRAVAVLTVMFSHVTRHSPTLHATAIAKAFTLGQHGVELFFVISGLCLAYPFLRRLEKTGTPGFDGIFFFAKRIVRIVPPYYIAVALFAVFSLTGLWRAAAVTAYGDGITAHLTLKGLLSHLAFGASDGQVLNGSFWTLRIEAIWYLLFPLLLFAFIRNRSLFYGIGAVCCVAAVVHVMTNSGRYTFLLALPAFMLGIVAADMRIKSTKPRMFLWPLLIVTGVVAVIADYTAMPWSRLVWDVAAFAFIALASQSALIRKALCFRGLVWIGVASYSIYLVHEPIIITLEYARIPEFVAWAVSLAAGFAFWWAIERPITHDPLRKRLVDAIAGMLRLVIPRTAARRPAPAIRPNTLP